MNKRECENVILLDINSILRETIAFKNITHKPIKFWTPQLKKAIRLQNKARKRIGQARKRREDVTGPYYEYKKAQAMFRKLFKKARKEYVRKQIQEACKDTTGAKFSR
jgi:hypothetical protein